MNERTADHIVGLAIEWVAAARSAARATSSRSMEQKDQDDARDEFVAAVNAAVEADKQPPYPVHCTQPDKCAGKGSCPRDPTCID